MSDRYRKGVEFLQRSGVNGVESTANQVAELSPDFARMAIEFVYGDLYTRDPLDLRTREMAAIAALAATGTALPQLRVHVSSALRLGISRGELIELLMQTAAYAGFPNAINALSGCHDLLADPESDCASCQRSELGAGQL